jgi:hypothetical protein
LDGSFTAIGYEELRLTSPWFLLPMLGFLQLLVLLELSVQAGIDILFFPLPLIGDPFPISLLVCLISLPILALLRVMRQPPSELNVEFSNRKHEGGTLSLSYTLTNGKRRTSLAAAKVRMSPGEPLTRMAHTMLTNVSGTNSSMVIVFKSPRISLQLGFETDEEMKRIYGMLC